MKKIAIVTGSDGGIGNATANHFADQGWLVYGLDINHTIFSNPNIHFIQTDISDAKNVQKTFEMIAAEHNGIDALVNNAAIQVCKSILDTTMDDWDRVMDINLRAIFKMVKEFFPLLQNNKGSIVNVSSVHAMATSKNIAAYACSKGALLTLTRSMAIEFAEMGVRVNAVLPGAIDTEMLRSGLSRGHVAGTNTNELVSALGEKHLVKRVGTTVEIAKAIFFLANNEQSSFMTGQHLVLDGGALAKLSTE